MNVSVKGLNDKYYKAYLTKTLFEKYNNFMMVSIGLTEGKDLPSNILRSWLSKGVAKEITQIEWNHMGCQSYCINRGDARCGW